MKMSFELSQLNLYVLRYELHNIFKTINHDVSARKEMNPQGRGDHIQSSEHSNGPDMKDIVIRQ